jgi:NhaP-type Na+/H+ or K+/H+ antiporter
VFIYIGAIMPWSAFGNFAGITPWRLVVLGICVMLLRRLPWVIALVCLVFSQSPFSLTLEKVHFIPALPTWREAGFAGFFGPIGKLLEHEPYPGKRI